MDSVTTDTSDRGVERLICAALTGAPCDPPERGMARERPSSYGAGWICGDPQDYDREYCVDLGQDSPTRRKFQQNARIEHDKALERAMTELLADHTELFKQFSDNESFHRWLSEMVFAATYLAPAAAASASGNKDSQ